MNGRALAITTIAALSTVAALGAQPASPPPRAMLDRYCVTCHNEGAKAGGLRLERLDLADVGAHADVWEKVVRKLRAGAMPPPGAPRPDPATHTATRRWLEDALDRAATAHPNPGRVPALHRLNRAEYANAIRDLLAVDIDASALLPADDSGYGFDNIADVLSVSPLLAERYLSAALRISRLAVGDPAIMPVTETFTTSKYLRQDERLTGDLPFASRGGLAIHHYFPVDADYIAKIFLDRTYDGRIRGIGRPTELEVRVDGVKVKELMIGGGGGRGARNADFDGVEVRFAAKAGPTVVGVSFVRNVAKPEGMLRPAYPVTSYEYAGDTNIEPAVARVELRGPYDVKGHGDSPSRRRIFLCEGNAQTAAADEACAKRILTTLARRAYRRPASDGDVQPLMAFYRGARANGSFDSGIEAALRRLLVSPDFLFRIEADRLGGAPYRISDVELASRLSFFLWSSIPDDQLLDLAVRDELKKPATLEQQVRRMLADPRSRALVDNFGGQWLYLRNLRLVSPARSRFPISTRISARRSPGRWTSSSTARSARITACPSC